MSTPNTPQNDQPTFAASVLDESTTHPMNGGEVRQILNLGYANGWGEVPQIVKDCAAKDHTKSVENEGRCLNRYYCEKCGYEYKVDSSD